MLAHSKRPTQRPGDGEAAFTWGLYRDRQCGVQMAFHYAGQGRLPQAVTVQTAQGSTSYLPGFDQVGSLKAVAAQEPNGALRVVKVIDFDSFGNVLSDTNPGFFIPLAFARWPARPLHRPGARQ